MGVTTKTHVSLCTAVCYSNEICHDNLNGWMWRKFLRRSHARTFLEHDWNDLQIYFCHWVTAEHAVQHKYILLSDFKRVRTTTTRSPTDVVSPNVNEPPSDKLQQVSKAVFVPENNTGPTGSVVAQTRTAGQVQGVNGFKCSEKDCCN